jgi:Cu+-exporting ATPase
LARLNILVRGGEPLENIKDARTLVLDKTGTVTLAEPELKEVIPIKMQKKELLEIVASVESRFNHPIADSILNFAKGQGITNFKNVKETEDIPGRCIKAIVEEKEVIIGSPETLESIGIALPDVEYKGRAIWIAVDRDLKGIIVIQDIMHSEMKDLAEKIRSYGIKKVILATGDNEANEAKRVAKIVGADEYYFSCKPTDKTALVKKRQSEGKVIMIGDGVNDAPSLAAANVGIAIGGHKNVNLAIKSSDIVVLGDDAKHVLKIFKLSKKMGNPILAAFLHHISSVFVVANAARLYIGKHSKF